jgi:hypothetical protein
VSADISPRDFFSRHALLESAVFALDRVLRWRNGVFEYSLDPQCLFRLEQRSADDTLVLGDGTEVRAGDPVLVLHLWNEHLPLMGRGGPGVAWAHKVSRGIRSSLLELVGYLELRPDLNDICVLYADFRVSGAKQAARAARTMARYGFETASECVDRRRAPQRMADALFVLMMAGVTNPCTVRGAPMRQANLRIFISRAVHEHRYAARCAHRGRPPEPSRVKPTNDDLLTGAPEGALAPAPCAGQAADHGIA